MDKKKLLESIKSEINDLWDIQHELYKEKEKNYGQIRNMYSKIKRKEDYIIDKLDSDYKRTFKNKKLNLWNPKGKKTVIDISKEERLDYETSNAHRNLIRSQNVMKGIKEKFPDCYLGKK